MQRSCRPSPILDKQRAQLRLVGRRYLIDVVMQTPQRFSDAFRAAVEAELPAFGACDGAGPFSSVPGPQSG